MREDTEKSVAFNHNKAGFLGLLVTLGIVFGDIGTSPLYVMKAILHTGETINENTILGALSCIIWTLTLQTTIKYVCVALRADNNGEGGILALYALLHKMKRKWIYLLAIIGASTLLADGIITPAITVTTAIEGLESISPHLPVIPITLGIITIIFFVQRFGTESIGKSFGVFIVTKKAVCLPGVASFTIVFTQSSFRAHLYRNAWISHSRSKSRLHDGFC